jgi:hypothetical protein
VTNQGEDEWLGDALDRELILGVPGGMDVAVGLDYAKAEKAARVRARAGI